MKKVLIIGNASTAIACVVAAGAAVVAGTEAGYVTFAIGCAALNVFAIWVLRTV